MHFYLGLVLVLFELLYVLVELGHRANVIGLRSINLFLEYSDFLLANLDQLRDLLLVCASKDGKAPFDLVHTELCHVDSIGLHRSDS